MPPLQSPPHWLQRSARPVLDLPRPLKRALVLLLDAALCVLTVWLAFYLRTDQWLRWWGEGMFQPQWAALAALLIALPLFVAHGFYRQIFRHSGLAALRLMLRAFALYALLFATVVSAIGLPGVPRSVGVIQPMLLLLAVGASRAFARYWLGDLYQGLLARTRRPGAVIYGAGRTGRQLAAGLANSLELQVVAFVDDDERLHGHVLDGLPIHGPQDLPLLEQTRQVSAVLLAMPGLTRTRRNAILERLRPLRVAVRTLPSLADLARGRIGSADLHELDLDDLLGREPVQPKPLLLQRNTRAKVVLVTGAGGSIGSELCRQILALQPRRLLLLEQSEFALYAIHHELLAQAAAVPAGAGAADAPDPDPRLAAGPDGSLAATVLVPLLASVQDRARLQQIFSTWRPDTVYHAAAYKHVPLVEHNPAEGIRNNVFGTLRTVQAALEGGVADFVLISTDKAVRPTNVMGASKRLAELLLQALAAQRGGTRLSMVRFGNVLGSSGSVVPRFRQQIRDGGPITLTHPEVTRYFMSIPEAAQLVIQAGAMAEGGDVFVLDMGQPVRIIDLARRMVELSGLRLRDTGCPDGDIALEITGLRPGEKLHEELLLGNDPRPTLHPRIMKAHEAFLPWSELEPQLQALLAALEGHDVAALLRLLQGLVPGYTPGAEIADWVHLEQAAARNGQGV